MEAGPRCILNYLSHETSDAMAISNTLGNWKLLFAWSCFKNPKSMLMKELSFVVPLIVHVVCATAPWRQQVWASAGSRVALKTDGRLLGLLRWGEKPPCFLPAATSPYKSICNVFYTKPSLMALATASVLVPTFNFL